MRLLALLFIATLITACASTPEDSGDSSPAMAEADQSVGELRRGLTDKHPAAYFQLTRALFNSGKKNDAVVMYYVGQIRYRAYINTLPQYQAEPEQRRYEQLKDALGEPINEYAGRNLDRWVSQIDQALEWHRSNPYGFMPKDSYAILYNLITYDFEKLRDYIADNKSQIRAQRAQKGLPNE